MGVGAIAFAAALTARLDMIPPIPPTMSSTMSLSILTKAWSMGAIDLIGWSTKIIEYRNETTTMTRIIVTTTTTNPQIRISISSAVRSFGWSLNFVLQNRGHKILRASLGE